MTKNFILFLLILFPIVGYSGSDLRLSRYQINSKFTADSLFVNVDFKVSEKSTQPAKSWFLISPYANIQRVSSHGVTLGYYRSGDTLFFADELNKFKYEKQVKLKYSLPAKPFSNGNQLVLRREERWYPLRYNNYTSFSIKVELSEDYYILASAKADRKEQIIEIQAQDEGAMAIIIGRKEDITKQTVTTPYGKMNFYLYSGNDKPTINRIVDEARKSFLFYSAQFGKLNFNEYNFVEINDSKCEFGQSLSSLIIFGKPLIKEYQSGDSDWPSHEVAHWWFGRSLHINPQTEGRWFLEESVNEQVRCLFIENCFGADSLKNRMSEYKYYVDHYILDTIRPPILTIKNVSSRTTGILIYKQGPYILNQIRQTEGKENYDYQLKNFYRKHKKQSIGFESFKQFLDKMNPEYFTRFLKDK